MLETRPLDGLWIVVTRPRHQAAPLCQALEAAGGRVIRWPVLAIAPPSDLQRIRTIIRALADFDMLVFVSVNAARHALALIDDPNRLADMLIFAIGPGTASILKAGGLPQALSPSREFNSEALLAMPQLQSEAVSGKRVLIFRGQGGRERLAETLKNRGAKVAYAEVYRRIRPASDPGVLTAGWDRGALDVITVTSAQGLENLVAMVGIQDRQRLWNTPLLVVGERVAEQAAARGFQQPPIVVATPEPRTVIGALVRWRRQ